MPNKGEYVSPISISSVIEIEPFKVYFAILLLFAGIYIAYSGSLKETKKRPPGNDKKLKLLPLLYAGAFGAGIISSLFGVGGGIVFVPLFVFVLGMTLTTASPTLSLSAGLIVQSERPDSGQL